MRKRRGQLRGDERAEQRESAGDDPNDVDALDRRHRAGDDRRLHENRGADDDADDERRGVKTRDRPGKHRAESCWRIAFPARGERGCRYPRTRKCPGLWTLANDLVCQRSRSTAKSDSPHAAQLIIAEWFARLRAVAPLHGAEWHVGCFSGGAVRSRMARPTTKG